MRRDGRRRPPGCPGRRNPLRGGPRAFTLLEVMLVLVIIAMLSGVVLVDMHTTHLDMALDADAGSLVRIARVAQTWAREKGCVSRLVIEMQRGRYRIEWAPTPDRAFRPIPNFPGPYELHASVSFADVRSAGSGSVVIFRKGGASSRTEIVLKNADREKRVIEIQETNAPPRILTDV